MTVNRKYIALDVHSFVDVITNSSTEIFICNTDKSLDQVESILRDKLGAFNALHDTSHVFEDTFEKPYVYTQDMLDDDSGWDYSRADNVGKIMIIGAEDNSVPYEMWDLINDIFDAHNEHLG